MAQPTSSGVDESADDLRFADEMPHQSEDTLDQELDGFDAEELDAILDHRKAPQTETKSLSPDRGRQDTDERVELDDTDLDMDFELDVYSEDAMRDAQTGVSEPKAALAQKAGGQVDDSIDWEMDFELEDGEEELIRSVMPDPDAFEADLDMDFDLDGSSAEDDTEMQASSGVGDLPDAEVEPDIEPDDDLPFDEDVELALDDFEDVLGDADGRDPGGSQSVEITEEETETQEALSSELDETEPDLGLGAGTAAMVAGAAAAAGLGGLDDAAADSQDQDLGDDLDISGLADFLDEEDDDQGPVDGEQEDVELSLDDSFEVASDETDAASLTGEGLDASAYSDITGEDLELDGLDELLDEVDESTVVLESEDEAPAAGDELEFSLDEEISLEDTAEESDTIITSDVEGDEYQFEGLDDLFEESDDQSGGGGADNEALSEALSLDDETELEELDLDEVFAGDDTSGDTGTVLASQENGDDLDLGGGLDDLLDEADAEAPTATDNGEELSLADELELSLDDDFSVDDASDETGTVLAGGDDSDDLGLGDLGDFLDEADDASQSAEVELSLDEDLELSLSEDTHQESQATDEPELNDFDTLLEEDEDTAFALSAESEAASESESLDDDFELLLDDDELQLSFTDDEDETSAGKGIDDLEELELDIGAEFEDELIAQADDGIGDDLVLEDELQDEDLDLTDIEKMLEDDSIVPEKEDAALGKEFDLDSGEAGNDLGFDNEIDLSELEEAIDSADQDDHGDLFADEGQELELEFDLEPEKSEGGAPSEEFALEDDSDSLSLQGAEDGDDDLLDLSDLELTMEEEKPVLENDVVDAGDIQLEFQIDEGGGELPQEADASKTASAITTSFLQDDDDFSGEETIATEAVHEPPGAVAEAPAPAASGARKPLIIVVVLVLLAVCGYFGLNFVAKQGIRIPIIGDFLNTSQQDPSGIVNLSTLGIKSKFVENDKAGRMFVITGKVRNDYSIARKLVRLRGKLYTKGKSLAKTEHTFAGLIISDVELSKTSAADIKKRLNSTTGQDLAVTIEAGKTAPFMIVFTQLPADLDEFVIERVSSIKAQ